MQRVRLKKRHLLIILIGLSFSWVAFGAQRAVVKFQGKVMELDVKKGTMSVNEKMVVWDGQTTFRNDRGAPVTADALKIRTWVYVEGVSDSGQEKISARKVYLLPKYIYQKERHLYPFLGEE